MGEFIRRSLGFMTSAQFARMLTDKALVAIPHSFQNNNVGPHKRLSLLVRHVFNIVRKKASDCRLNISKLVASSSAKRLEWGMRLCFESLPHLLARHGITGFKLDRIRVEVCVWKEIFF